jgi:hypothetical protein
VPKKSQTPRKPLYRRKAPKPVASAVPSRNKSREDTRYYNDIPHAHLIAPSHFTFREDGSIGAPSTASASSHPQSHRAEPVLGAPTPSTINPQPSTLPHLVYHDDARKLWLYHGNSLELLDAIAAKYSDGRFDAIFADPPAWP